MGLGLVPPMNPEVAEMTPSSLLKMASTHQKHPAPRVICLCPSATTGMATGFF